jgi:orotidine-5'-phosphate decarboxylase
MADVSGAHMAGAKRAARQVTPIVALDVSSEEAATKIVRRLGDLCRFYKVGSELFAAAGPAVVRALKDLGCDVFLDLKLHDIPNTVRGGCRNVASLGAKLLTVHAVGGVEMMAAAVEGARDGSGGECAVLAVTVLTSLDGGRLAAVWGRGEVDVGAEVLRLAGLARAAGVAGVVCGGGEISCVRAAYGAALSILVPGVRLEGSSANDQQRVTTVHAAAEAGADYLVIGRTVTAAPDPRAAMGRVRQELGG